MLTENGTLDAESIKKRKDVAWLLSEEETKRLFPLRFNGCSCHVAYPDQLHTFVGDCSSSQQVVVLVPEGDIRFTSRQIHGMNIIAAVSEHVSADYLDFLEEMQISYIFAGSNGHDERIMQTNLRHDFGIKRAMALT